MSSLTTKTALRQLEKTDFLVVSTRTQKPTVNDRLQHIIPELFGEDFGEAPPAPDWNQLQDWTEPPGLAGQRHVQIVAAADDPELPDGELLKARCRQLDALAAPWPRRAGECFRGRRR